MTEVTVGAFAAKAGRAYMPVAAIAATTVTTKSFIGRGTLRRSSTRVPGASGADPGAPPGLAVCDRKGRN